MKRRGKSVVLTPKEKSRQDQWKDFFAALDMFDPRFPFERHQPPEQVRQSLDELFQPPRRRPAKKRR